MSPPKTFEPGDYKTGLISTETHDISSSSSPSESPSPKSSALPKPVSVRSNSFLSAPLTGPIRPLSPDHLSVLSDTEFEQLSRPRTTRHASHTSTSYPSSTSWRAKLQASWIRNKGLALMLLAQFFGTLMNVATRKLEVEGNNGKGLHPFNILFARMGITVVLASTYMWRNKTPHFPFGAPEVRWLLIARGFGGFFGVTGMYWSLLYLPLADATVITFLAPGLACWACSFLINEPFTRVEKIGTLVSFVGVVFIARPTSFFAAFSSAPPASGTGDMAAPANDTSNQESDASNYDDVTPEQRLMAVGIALIGVLGASVAYTTIRWIGKRAHPLISVNYFATWCTIVSFVMQFALPQVGFLLPADVKEWGYLIFLGTCGFIMQFLLAAALSYEKSSRATNLTYCQMLFALGFDKLVFGHSPSGLSILGSSLILGSAIVVALQKNAAVPEKTGAEGGVDEEARMGLMAGEREVRDVQLRTIR
ncbi:hypothetical protein TI39_contig5901g00005 [Zymoseptoria brevis]|uniref:EamA domain-containing protein n=1 Tax=Zymoseptoria brevis TaxID=1047168 RepID=A0A0F4G479_9PEZI|nr:hypothetical protein TI39_contig5901g00005 [Zymoseptoria brevis]